MKILQFPIARIIFWFVLGIVFSHYVNINHKIVFGFLAISLLFFGFYFFKSRNIFDQKSNFSISLYALFFIIGITTTIVHNDTFRDNHYIHNIKNFDKNHIISLTVIEKLKSTSNNNRYFARINEIDNKIASGKILLNFRKDSLSKSFIIGSRLQINDQLVHNFKPNNPNQFDYGKYLETKGVCAQIFTDASQVKINKNVEKNIWFYTSRFRNKIILNLAKSGFKKEELAVITALILGQQQDISNEVLRDYQYAGAVHILSVSGLHVGFILMFITFLLKPLHGNFIRLITVFISLWVFAIVAGLAPSVVRSAAMFSFVAVGMFLNRETNIYHTLVVSLFLILLFEPLFLFDIGFQLSYVALFFILWLQPLLKTLWQPKNKIIEYFWDIITVSFAAQIGAMPLSIYYFHQFPGLFFVTNLVLIPCLSVIMALGVLLMLLAYFNFVPMFLCKTVEMSITFTNGFINKIASIEAFVLKDIPLSFSLLIVSYLIVFSWVIWFKKPNFIKLTLALVSIFIFQILYIKTNWYEQKKQELIVFNIKKETVIAKRLGKNITLITNDTLQNNSFEQKMIQSYATANYCKITQTKKLTNLLYFHKNKILIIDKSGVYKTVIQPDVVILRDSPKLNLDRLVSDIKPKLVIADASNFKTYVAVWKATCIKEKIPFHSTYEMGFFKL